MILCEHHACRCARAAELAAMADRALTPALAGWLLAEAIRVHSEPVPCREGEAHERGG